MYAVYSPRPVARPSGRLKPVKIISPEDFACPPACALHADRSAHGFLHSRLPLLSVALAFRLALRFAPALQTVPHGSALLSRRSFQRRPLPPANTYINESKDLLTWFTYRGLPAQGGRGTHKITPVPGVHHANPDDAEKLRG